MSCLNNTSECLSLLCTLWEQLGIRHQRWRTAGADCASMTKLWYTELHTNIASHRLAPMTLSLFTTSISTIDTRRRAPLLPNSLRVACNISDCEVVRRVFVDWTRNIYLTPRTTVLRHTSAVLFFWLCVLHGSNGRNKVTERLPRGRGRGPRRSARMRGDP